MTSRNIELEEKHSIKWAHRSWSQHITGFIYMDHLYFSYYLLDLLETGFCSQHSIKNTSRNVIKSALNLLYFSEAAFVSINQCLFFETMFCSVQDSNSPGSPLISVATPPLSPLLDSMCWKSQNSVILLLYLYK